MISKFIKELSNDEVKYNNNEKKQELVSNLFRIYESLVERTCSRSKADLDRFAARDMFVEYISLASGLIDNPKHKMNDSVNSGRSIMRVIHAAGFTCYASLAVVCLFAQAKTVNLKADSGVMIDCERSPDGTSKGNAPLYLSKMILLDSFDVNRSLASL